jgi:hypothetical protein
MNSPPTEVVHMDEVMMLNRALSLGKMLKSPVKWMRRMNSQWTKSELARRLTLLPPLRLFA